MHSEITADQNLRLAQKMLAQVGEVNALKMRIAAVLADVDQVDRRARARKDRTHYEDCWLEHTRCLAARIRATLTGEDHPQ